MEILQIGQWNLQYDTEATCHIYSRIPFGGAEECGCDMCRNFIMARDQIYPKEVHDTFEILGIDMKKETEASHVHRIEPGWHFYLGMFHFIGKVEHNKASNNQKKGPLKLVPVTKNFSWGFLSKSNLAHKEFAEHTLVQIDFSVVVPWLLNGKEPA